MNLSSLAWLSQCAIPVDPPGKTLDGAKAAAPRCLKAPARPRRKPRHGLEDSAKRRQSAGHHHVRVGRHRRPALSPHLWLTHHCVNWRSIFLRAYWTATTRAAIAVTTRRLLRQGWCELAQLPPLRRGQAHGASNSYWR